MVDGKIVVTEAMLDAGAYALIGYDPDNPQKIDAKTAVREIFEAMWAAHVSDQSDP